jgi:hypothetical protein
MAAPKKLRAGDPKSATPSKPKVLIYGLPGAGKTWAAIDFPSVYYIDTEGGADLAHYTDKLKKSGAAYMGPADGSNDFPTLLDEVQQLATTKHAYKTLVIDSFSKLFNTQVAITQEGMEKRGEVDAFGASKKQAIGYTRRLVAWLNRLDMNVILICHQKSQWKDGKEVGVTFDGWDKLEYELHLAMRIQKVGAERRAFIGKTRLIPFPEGESFPWSYADFAKRYGQGVMETEAKPTVLASDAQVTEFKTLVSKLKLAPETIEKLNAEPAAEMEAEKIEKWLVWLRGQEAAQAAKAPAA